MSVCKSADDNVRCACCVAISVQYVTYDCVNNGLHTARITAFDEIRVAFISKKHEKEITHARSATSMIEVKLRYNYFPCSDYDKYRPRVPRWGTLQCVYSAHIIILYTIKIYILNKNLYINLLFYILHFLSYIILIVTLFKVKTIAYQLT